MVKAIATYCFIAFCCADAQEGFSLSERDLSAAGLSEGTGGF